MDFKTAVTSVLKNNYTNFKGRARRSEYWYFYLFNVIVNVVLMILATLLGKVPVLGVIISLINFVVTVYLLIGNLSVSFRRMHDTGRSAWWLLLGLIPLVGWIILIVLFVQDSQPGENAYGKNPKGV